MLSFIIKKCALLVLLLLVLPTNAFLFCKPYMDPKIRISQHGSYTFQASYIFRTPLFPTHLPVKLIVESNESNGICHDNMWFPMMQLMNVRFTLNNTPQRLVIWPTRRDPHRKYGMEELDTLYSSIWHPAIKKLAMDVGAQWYGKQRLERDRATERALKQTPSYISIKPVKDWKLFTRDTLGVYPSRSVHRPMGVNVVVQLETDQLGKKRVVAVATFSDRAKRLDANKRCSIIKFMHTKHGLKELSKKRTQCSSKWYPLVKKVATRSVARYFRFKRRHTGVTRMVGPDQLYRSCFKNRDFG